MKGKSLMMDNMLGIPITKVLLGTDVLTAMHVMVKELVAALDGVKVLLDPQRMPTITTMRA